MIVIVLLAVIGSFGVVMSMDSYRGFMFRSERDAAVAALQRARSLAVSNICEDTAGAECVGGKPHGVRFEKKQYTIFQGSVFDGRDAGEAAFDQVIPIDTGGVETDAGSPVDVIFDQLSGRIGSGSAADITISDQTGRASTISINEEGRIAWSN